MKLTDLLLGRGRDSDDQSETNGSTRSRAGAPTGSIRNRCGHDLTLDRRRTQSEYADRRKKKNKPECEPASRGRARTLSSWTSNSGGNAWALKRKSSVHAVDFGVLQSSHLPDRDDAPEVSVVPNEKLACEDNTCLICMGKATKRRPLVNIPCKKECNLAPVHSKCIYEWKAQKKGTGTCPLCRGALGDIDYTPPDVLKVSELKFFNSRRRFVQTPVPKAAGTVRCYLKVKSGFWGSPARYEMYLQAPSMSVYPGGPLPDEKCPREGDVLLMVAKKSLNKWGCSRVRISLDAEGKDYKRTSANYLGQVQADFSGLGHTISVPYTSNVHGSNAGGHLEIGAIQFSQNRVGSASGPRRLQCILPSVEEVEHAENSCCSESTIHSEEHRHTIGEEEVKLESGSITIDSPRPEPSLLMNEPYESDSDSDDEPELKRFATKNYRPSSRQDTLAALLRRNSQNLQALDSSKFVTGQNKEPYWLETIHAYSLDFGGRVTLPSNKNFQLELHNRVSDEIGLQFGKVAAGTDVETTSVYTLDFTFPLSPLQAFGFAICSCDRKLACA